MKLNNRNKNKEIFDDFFKKHEILIKYLICFSENAALSYLPYILELYFELR